MRYFFFSILQFSSFDEIKLAIQVGKSQCGKCVVKIRKLSRLVHVIVFLCLQCNFIFRFCIIIIIVFLA